MQSALMHFWNGLSRTKRILFATFLAFILILLIILGTVVASAISDNNISIKNPTVTNITESAFTVVWGSDQPYAGNIIYKEGESSWPIILAQSGQKVASDDRDSELSLKGEYKIVDAGTKDRYTHHVTIRGLKPETQYSFRIGGKINGKDADIKTVKTAAVNESISTPDPAYGKVQAKDPDDVVIVFTIIKPQDQQSQTLYSTVTNPTGGYTIDAKSFKLTNFKATDIAATVYNRNANPIDLGFNKETYKPLETLILDSSQASNLNTLPGFVKGISAQVLRGTQCVTSGQNSAVCRFNGAALPAANCTSGGLAGDGKVDCKCSNGKVVLDVAVSGGFADIPQGGCTIPTQQVPNDTPNNNPTAGLPTPTPQIRTTVGDPNASCGYYSCGNKIVAGREVPGFCGSTDLCTSKAALCGGYETYRSACGVTTEAPSLPTDRSVVSGIAQENVTSVASGGLPANILELETLVRNKGYSIVRRNDLPNSTIERAITPSNDVPLSNIFNSRSMNSWTYGSGLTYLDLALDNIGSLGAATHIQSQLHYRIFIGTSSTILTTNTFEINTQLSYSQSASPQGHMNFQLYAVCEPGYVFSGQDTDRCIPDSNITPASYDLTGLSQTELDALRTAVSENNQVSIADLTQRIESIYQRTVGNESFRNSVNSFISSTSRTVGSTIQGIEELLVSIQSVDVAIENNSPANNRKLTPVTDQDVDINAALTSYTAETNLEERRWIVINFFGQLPGIQHCAGGVPSLDFIINQDSNVDIGPLRSIMNEAVDQVPNNAYCYNISPLGNNSYQLTTFNYWSTRSDSLPKNLVKPSLAQASNSGSFEVNESGRYAFFREGQRIADKDIQIINGKATIRLFTDLNGNGVRDANEDYLSDYSQITLSREASTINFNLTSGWNLINIPMVDNRTENTVVKASDLINYWIGQGAYVTSVAKYEGDRFITIVKRENGQLYDTDFDIIPGQALFIFNRGNPANVTFSGNTFPEGVNLRLNNSWNMVGIMAGVRVRNYNSEGLLEKLAQQSFQADTISQFEGGSYQSVVKDSGTLFGNNFNIIPTKGYFVRVKDGGGDKEFIP